MISYLINYHAAIVDISCCMLYSTIPNVINLISLYIVIIFVDISYVIMFVDIFIIFVRAFNETKFLIYVYCTELAIGFICQIKNSKFKQATSIESGSKYIFIPSE